MAEIRDKTAARQRAASARGWSPRGRRAKMVGELIPALMRPAFEKYGFPAAAILTDWAAIAGPELASYTAPERLKWPRKSASGDDAAADKGATLILRVSGARALEVDHLRPRLIERINAAFGYRAVSDIRIVQAPLPKSDAQRASPAREPAMSAHKALAEFPDGPLKHAFARMAAGVKSRQRKTEPAPG